MALDLVAILDTETTDLDPSKGECIELALVRYSIRHRSVVDTRSWLIAGSGRNEAEHINHIRPGILKYGMPKSAVWQAAHNMVSLGGCEAILAHNADFDMQWVPGIAFYPVPWIDTCGAVDWPMQTRPGSSLTSLALEHGLAVVDPHRALQDCLLLSRLLTRVEEISGDVSARLERGLRPRALFCANVSYDDRDKAKEAGFHWEPNRKMWLRKMAIEDAAELPFPTKQV